MFPSTDNQPAPFGEHPCRLFIAFAVPRDLHLPELAVGSGWNVMSRAPMPETSIYEHGDPLPRKGNINRTAVAADWSKIDAKSKASSMQETSNS